MIRRIFALSLFWANSFLSAGAQRAPADAPPQPPFEAKFEFTTAAARPGYFAVKPDAVYSDAAGYGFEAAPNAPNSFSVKVPEGNYRVHVVFGDAQEPTVTTIKAEAGRLMADRVAVPAGQIAERVFMVNVRTPHLPKLPLNATGREEVTLDQFDLANKRDWDDRLTIEIDSQHFALRSIEVTSAPDVPTVFIAGDSTVTDRDASRDVSWGQILPLFFTEAVAISNQAQSGETLKSFLTSLRFDKVLSRMKPGDYLLMQFATNDSKIDWPQTYAGADTTYKAYVRAYIAEVRLRGATPILVTAMDHGLRGSGLPAHGLGGYPKALREVAAEQHVPLLDLYAMSETLYSSAGADAPKILVDGTHSSAYGGYEFAKCIATVIRQQKLGLARYLAPSFQDFDPAHPDAASKLRLEEIFNRSNPMPWDKPKP